MSNFEYKVIPAPVSGKRGKGVKGADGRFANALSKTINELAGEGWEYIRSESLPSVERVGLMRKRQESFQNVLVFRRTTDAQPVEQVSQDNENESYNPFKKFSTRKEPVVVSAAATSEVEDAEEEIETSEEIADDVDEFADAEIAKLLDRPSKPAD